MREMGAEFATAFPKIAARLALDPTEVADPYVERLLEGFSFLAARVRLKLDSEFPRFTQHLLEVVYPHYLTPTPSMAIVQLTPSLTEGSLAAGFVVPRGTMLRGQIPRGEVTACQFRTAHDVTLWPVEIAEARYTPFAADLPLNTLGLTEPVQGGVAPPAPHAGAVHVPADRPGSAEHVPGRERRGRPEALRAHSRQRPRGAGVPARTSLAVVRVAGTRRDPAGGLRSRASADSVHDPLVQRLPAAARVLRVLRALPVRGAGRPPQGAVAPLRGRRSSWRSRWRGETRPWGRSSTRPASRSTARRPSTSSRGAPIGSTSPISRPEHHVVVDRTKPMDFEVYSVERVVGYSEGLEAEQEFRPFYASFDSDGRLPAHGYFTHPARAARALREAAPRRPADQLHRHRGVALAGRSARGAVLGQISGSSRWTCWSRTATCRC